MLNEKDIAKPTVGWREWVALGGLGIKRIKAKIDTGARTSSLHAYDIKKVKVGRKIYVQFKVHPLQRNLSGEVTARAEFVEMRWIRDSGGKLTERPVIVTQVTMGPYTWDLELTLTNRDEMGFRMLLGRQAVRNLFLVDPAKSYLVGERKKKKSAINKEKAR